MTYGNRVDNVRSVRWNAGELTSGFAKSATVEKATDDEEPAEVKVEATFEDGTYTLKIEAHGEKGTVAGVEPDDLSAEITRVVNAVTKAVRTGEISRRPQRDASLLGLKGHTNRDSLRFG
ncbi:hypothetical protein SFC88_21070 [Nocardioides sp. HM23]|uniref:hypothetical protein n=1 Tax=Nocardioides bizhenqiangii TaxID=3095076 RepID=UPI002ACA7A1B|nr:hypothetical protein [Nocardioides sp. HM23]MDZ5623339.1 hypothetical protein [Nocardioides sp. HM23]